MPRVIFYDNAGEEPVVTYMERRSDNGREAEGAKMFRYLELLAEHGDDLPRVSANYAKIIDRDERSFELRPQPHRIAYVEHDAQVVLLHAWRKQQQALSTRALSRAQSAANDWRIRHP